MQDREWSWVSEDGIEYQGGQRQLENELSSERLPAYTLVSRMDWRDWLPAMQVSELQRALPLGFADAPRHPTLRSNGPKLPPPLGQYPRLRERALDLRRHSTQRPELVSRPGPSAPPSFPPAYPQYGEDDFDEPTVQIDAEQLERALSQSRAEEPHASQPSGSSPPSPVSPKQANPILHRMPTFPGYLPERPPSANSQPPIGQGAQLGGYSAPPMPTEPSNAFGGNEPTLASRVDSQPPPSDVSDGRQFRRGRGKTGVLLALAAGAGLLAAWLWERSPEPNAVTTPPPTTVTAPPREAAPVEVPLRCSVDQSLQLSEFAHVQVPPITRRVSGSDQLAIGFAQTSRLAVGVTIDPISLAVSRVFTESQSSPLWSVLPVNEEKLTFHTNRAASTLRSTTTIPSRPPLAFGLGRDGLAVRGPDDVVDRLLWKADWDTVSIPEIDNVSEQLYMTALRAGGERGSVLLGKIAADGSAQGELQALAGLEGRLDSPSLFVTSEQVYVAVAAGAGSSKDTLYVATTSSPDLPKSATEIMKVSEGITSARLTSVADGKLLLQYTEGAIGDQRVVARVLDQQLKPEADLLELSPSGRDAYEGTVVNHQGTLLSLFFVRHQHGHELWLARLQCE